VKTKAFHVDTYSVPSVQHISPLAPASPHTKNLSPPSPRPLYSSPPTHPANGGARTERSVGGWRRSGASRLIGVVRLLEAGELDPIQTRTKNLRVGCSEERHILKLCGIPQDIPQVCIVLGMTLVLRCIEWLGKCVWTHLRHPRAPTRGPYHWAWDGRASVRGTVSEWIVGTF